MSDCRWRNVGLFILSSVLCTTAYAADLKLRVVCPTQDCTIDAASNTITVRPNETVTLEWEVSNWGGSTKLRTWQVRLDSAGYTSGTTGSLSPLTDPDDVAGAFIETARGDFVHAGFGISSGVNRTTLDYMWFSVILTVDGPTDPGSPRYMATLKVVTSSDASGTFVVGANTDVLQTLLANENSDTIPINSFVAANIVVAACTMDFECDDGNSCTADTCDLVTGCVNDPISGSCDDGDACTTVDTCSQGICVGSTPPACDDGNVCTDDSCNSVVGCVSINNTDSCDDGDPGTTGDTCSAGICVGFSPPTEGAPCLPAPSGMVSWWTGDADGTDSVGANNGTLNGGMTAADSSGLVDGAFRLDGVDDFILVGSNASLATSSFTACGWFFQEVVGPHSLFEFHTGGAGDDFGPQVFSQGDRSLFANIVDSTHVSGQITAYHLIPGPTGIISDNTWHHYAMTYDGSTGAGRLYLDGQLVGQEDFTPFTPRNTIDLYMGHRPTFTYMDGLLDEVMYFDRALGASEIADIVTAGSAGVCKGAIVYVDAAADGQNNGTSWADAYVNLQDGLVAASSGDEIWVADGTYMPDGGYIPTGGVHTTGSGSTTATFQLINGVDVYGGFAGGETTPFTRDPETNVTVLSGDLNDDNGDTGCSEDSPDCDTLGERCLASGVCIKQTSITDNSANVVKGSGTDATALLDGFTITSGKGPLGGGIINDAGSPTIANCTFTRNSGTQGAAMFNSNASSPTVTDSTFLENTVSNQGGAAYDTGAGTSPTFERCTFSTNSAGFGSGAMANVTNAGPINVKDCIFEANSADNGGAIWNSTGTTNIFTNTTFIDNFNPLGGPGAVDNSGLGTTTSFVNCKFFGNTSNQASGGAVSVRFQANVTATNCVFSGNSGATGNTRGGAVYVIGAGSTFEAINCTISQNVATLRGGGVSSRDSGAATLTNCLLWGNSDPGGTDESAQVETDGGTLTINHTLIQGLTGGLGGTGNIGGDPLFVDDGGPDNTVGTIDDDLRLSSGSPAIDAGDNAAVPGGTVTDLDGNTRFVDDPDTVDTGIGTAPIVDMGAFEFDPPPLPLFVKWDAAGLNNGTSWANAFTSLQDALAFADPPVDIWVAAGIYKPDIGAAQDPGLRTETFQLINGVSVFGGFAGNETLLIERDPSVNETILSGDLSGDDGPDFANNGENSYHVVTGSSTDATARLNGFTITAGHADGSFPNNSGAGMHNDGGSPTVKDCTFAANLATFRSGGMYNENSSNPTVIGCTFVGNTGPNGGGMLNIFNSNPTVTDCVFTGNAGEGGPGGMKNWEGCSPLVSRCMFIENSGSGMANVTNCSPTVIDCSFVGNTATALASGGGMRNGSNSSPEVTNCLFSGNTASSGGGMSNWFSSSPTVTNCLFSANSASTLDGGGMHIRLGSSPSITNCTFSRNTATGGQSGGVIISEDSSPVFSNCILWGNEDVGGVDESAQFSVVAIGTGTPAINHSIVQGLTGALGGTGNIGGNPFFVDADGPDNIVGTLDDDLRLSPSSPAIDAADNTAVPADTADLDGDGDTSEAVPFDLLGDLRFRNDPLTVDSGVGPAPIADMGAIEFVPRVHVDAAAIGTNDGSTWTNAYPNLQDALAAVQVDPDIVEIWVAAGIYRPDIGAQVPSGERTVSFQLLDGVAIYGGFVGSELALSERDVDANETILSGDLGGDDEDVDCTQDPSVCNSFGGRCLASGVCIVKQNNGDNSYHVTTGSGTNPTAVLDGFTVTAGNANGACCTDDRGAGMFNGGGSPMVRNCTFVGNRCSELGGGMFNDAGSPNVTDCTFTENFAGNAGGGMFNFVGSNPTVTNCTFSRNSGGVSGGGMESDASNPNVTNCTFSNNTAAIIGGGGMINFNGSNSNVTNCTFIGNSGGVSGGGMWNEASSPNLTNCTFSGNSANAGAGGGMFNFNGSSPTLTNCIFWGNSDLGGTDESAQIDTDAFSTPTVNYSLIQGLTGALGGTGNIGDDPLFVDADGADDIFGTLDDDLRLNPGSPAIDAGNNSANLADTDLDGNPRRHDDPSIDDTGLGDAPIIDLGAFEFQGITPTGACCDSCTGECQEGLLASECPVTSTFTSGVGCTGICEQVITSNDNCAGAQTIVLGTTPFSTSCATLDGPAPVDCESDPLAPFVADIWYDFTAPFSGDLEVGACDVNYDNMIAVYSNGTPNCACPADNETLIECSDEGCAGGEFVGGGGLLEIPVVGGNCYLIRVGGFGGQGNVRGTGNITLSFVGVPSRLFVDASAINGANNGLSWADALLSLQDALDQARESGGVAEIWVAAGTYKTDEGAGVLPNDRSASFVLVDGVKLYGGFAGGEANVTDRDPSANPTFLSGDIGIPDVSSINSFNVVKALGTGTGTLLDGFTIEGGLADGVGDQGRGGGLLVDGVLTVNDCRFLDNEAIGNGGGILSLAPNLVITESSFAGNVAAGEGGGLHLAGADASVINCTFALNTAGKGGAIAVAPTSSEPELVQCIFDRNFAADRGGALFTSQANPLVTNCTFYLNSAEIAGGSVFSQGQTVPTIVNSILWDGGPEEIAGDQQGTAVVTYSDVKLQLQDPRCSNDDTRVCITDADCLGGKCGVLAGTGNINADPSFQTPAEGDFRLRLGSPCIDAGNSTVVLPSFDPDDNPRLYDDAGTPDTGTGPEAIVDMGVFEFFDCNANTFPDDEDIALGRSNDCNGNNIPDECEPDDCDEDGVPDECETSVSQQDCNGDGVCNGDEINNCASDPNCNDNDCNGNGIPDACDITANTSADCTQGSGDVGDGVPDECEPDCNEFILSCHGGFDEGLSCVEDANCCFVDEENCVIIEGACATSPGPDSCDIAVNRLAIDCNIDGIPDVCQAPEELSCLRIAASVVFSESGAEGTDTQVGTGGGSPPSPAVAFSSGVAEVVLDVDVNASLRTLQIGNNGAVIVEGIAVGDLTVTEPGGILVFGRLRVAESRLIDATVGQVTIGPGGSYKKVVGAGNTSAALLADTLTITSGTTDRAEGTVELTDDMSVTAREVVLDGRDTASTCGGVSLAATFHAPPRLVIRNSSLLFVENFTLLGTVNLTVGSSDPNAGEAPTIVVDGDLRIESKDPCQFNWLSGELIMSGGTPEAPKHLEVAGRELGLGPAGFNFLGSASASFNFGAGTGDTNFSICDITFAEDSNIVVSSEVTNTTEEPGPCLEALYAGTLTLGPNSTIAVVSTTIYYATLVDNGGNVEVVGCGGLVPLPACNISSDCDDGFFCTGTEVCVDISCQLTKSAGICQSSPPPCGEGEVCDESSDRCLRAGAPAALQSEGVGRLLRGRDVALVVPSSGGAAGGGPPGINEETALRVRLSSLHHPADPVPDGTPDFSALEGEVRYVNAFRDPKTNEIIVDCPDSAASGTSYKCATLGCNPEYLDWSTLLGGELLHISGSAIVPDSAYDVAQLGLVCQGNETTCSSSSAELHLVTGRWGDANGNLNVSIGDVVAVVDRVKDLPTAIPETQAYVRRETPVPVTESPGVGDIVAHVDALKLFAYPFSIVTCP